MKKIDVKAFQDRQLQIDIREAFGLGDVANAIHWTRAFLDKKNVIIPHEFVGVFWGEFRAAVALKDDDALKALLVLCTERDLALPLYLEGMNSVSSHTANVHNPFTGPTEP